ncbi:SDR family oxidoreductase [Thalassospiraceae bacterium LMO-SO8]|nr:SDR family oxidoreductase [Alphaproteobacteria bacterium LMO-S08]WND74977.1 SDR family oxidoreductase [Thalassospiraceae bacterium LMO-SO8]
MSYKREDSEAKELHLGDLAPGYTAELNHQVTQADVDAFAALTGDFNPIHLDPEFARATSFGKPIVHGMLTSAFISTMVGMLLPGKGALWTSQTLNFVRPAFVGDTITVRSEVTQVSPATRTLVAKVTITNQNGAIVVTGDSTVRLLGEAEGETAPPKSAAGKPASAIAPRPDLAGKAKETAGSVVLVTGGSRGIGAATALALAADGHAVAVNFLRDAEAADGVARQITAAGGRAVTVGADVSNMAAVDALFTEIEATLGAVTGIVHCAAPEPVPQPFGDVGWDDFEKQFRVQVGGAHHCAKRAIPGMAASGLGGALVFLGSIYGDSAPPPQQSAYVAAKAGLAGLTRSLASEFGPQGVRVNLVAPGMTNTQMIANLPDKAKMLAKMNTPLRRLAEPEDIARVIAFLIGDGGRHITGETIHVSGGVTMG